MTIKNTPVRPLVGGSAAAIFSSAIGPRIALAPETGAGSGGDDEAAKAAAAAAAKEAADAAEKKAADDKAAADAEAKKKAGGALSDKEAELLKEVMAKKKEKKELEERLKAFDGIDPAEVKKILTEREEAKKAAEKAELEKAEKAGEFDRVKAAMIEAHKKEVEAARAEAASTKDALSAALAQIDDLTVGSAFSNSKFVGEELVLTPGKARQVYGSHFEIVDGKLVAFDKPKGAKERTQLVAGDGETLGFEVALKKLVETDPDRDRLLRSKMLPGAGSKTADVKGEQRKEGTKSEGLTGVARIEAALAAKKAGAK